MLATLVIGLREGLEATLIIGIIAAFLRRNGVRLGPMWLGVALATALSVAVGVGLQLVAQSLPQAQQEGLEAIIGTVAVIFVTTMIVWMRKHSRNLKGELESVARTALGNGTAWALAGMAFLAVLKEGVETAVFLLATFQASSNATLAWSGAVIGIAAAIAIGYGIYTGGVRMNLSKFFNATGIVLIFIAGGLVLTVLRRAHEAGWLTIGQQRTVDLSWMIPNGSVQGAIVTGVLGIPPDPRLIELLGWLCYVVPVLAIAVWPKRMRPTGIAVPRTRTGIAAAVLIAAAALAIFVPWTSPDLPTTVAVRPAPNQSGQASATASVQGNVATLTVTTSSGVQHIHFTAADHRHASHAGVTAERWRSTVTVPAGERPRTLAMDDLIGLFGHIPVGISTTQSPGPFTAHWQTRSTRTLWSDGHGILDAGRLDTSTLTLTGGGLATSRTFRIDDPVWTTPAARVAASANVIADSRRANAELSLWKIWLPAALVIAAAFQFALAVRDRRRFTSPRTDTPDSASTREDQTRSTAYVTP